MLTAVVQYIFYAICSFDARITVIVDRCIAITTRCVRKNVRYLIF